MSAEHIKEAQKVWKDTKKLIKEGRIVREFKNGRRYSYFPDSKSNLVSHVRPHAKNAQDTYSLPVTDIKTGLNEYTKHCFWLNREYVKDYIYESEIKN